MLQQKKITSPPNEWFNIPLSSKQLFLQQRRPAVLDGSLADIEATGQSQTSQPLSVDIGSSDDDVIMSPSNDVTFLSNSSRNSPQNVTLVSQVCMNYVQTLHHTLIDLYRRDLNNLVVQLLDSGPGFQMTLPSQIQT